MNKYKTNIEERVRHAAECVLTLSKHVYMGLVSINDLQAVMISVL